MKPVYAMYLAVRAGGETLEPPTLYEALHLAARAVSECTGDDEHWQAWAAGGERKIVVKARGSRWAALQKVEGITIEEGGMSLRVFAPMLKSDAPKAIRDCQAMNMELERGRVWQWDTAMSEIMVNRDLHMSSGKTMAQVGHIARRLYRQLSPERQALFLERQCPVRIRLLSDEAFKAYCDIRGVSSIADAGHTETAPGTLTVAGRLITS